MFSKALNELTYEDIDDLVNVRKEREGIKLDFKRGIFNLSKAPKDISKDVSSFANASGGYLIYGIEDDGEIVGVERQIQNKDIDEWFNQIVSSNTEPPVFYYDPKIIEIPNTDKIILVIHIPESIVKPHIVTGKNNYYIRINDSSKVASHYQIRDMFEISRNRETDLNDFLEQRNLLNESSSDFCKNKNSERLYSDVPNKIQGIEKPVLLFSMIPKFPKTEKIKKSPLELETWLKANSSGLEPFPNLSLFYFYDKDIKLDGAVYKTSDSHHQTAYFEVLNNGFIENGFSTYVGHAYQNQQQAELKLATFLTPIIIQEMKLLFFAKQFYESIKYYDEVILQVSFANFGGYKLHDFHPKYRQSEYTRYGASDTSNKHHNNFKLMYKFHPIKLTEEEILKTVQYHSQKICMAFGLDKDYGFDENGEIGNSRRNKLF